MWTISKQTKEVDILFDEKIKEASLAEDVIIKEDLKMHCDIEKQYRMN